MIHLWYKLALFASIVSSATAESVTYSRGDQSAYLKAGGAPAARDPSQMKSLRREHLQEPSISFNYDDPRECTLYVAESSIPNAGLGTYTTVPRTLNEPIGHTEIGINMHDLHHHYPSLHLSKDFFEHYAWSSNNVAGGKFEANSLGRTMVAGLGMMPNDYPGLTNLMSGTMYSVNRFWEDDDSTLSVEGSKHETTGDVGRGAYSSHSGVSFHVTQAVEAGDELFLSYGPGWFQSRADLSAIPSAEQYKKAEQTLTQFMDRAKRDGLNIDSLGLLLQERYDQRIYKADWLKGNPRLKAALPESVSDIPAVLEMGAAAFSIRDKKRSVEWIEKHGMCMENMVAGTTTIPQAGRGAFATRAFQKDATIMTTPVITMTLEQLKLRDENGDFMDEGYQQILNYCYGHMNSTLLFFPAAPAVNFINNENKDKANAEIRWSTSPHHHSDWLDAPLNKMKTEIKRGLAFDIVATKDIKRGDEILVYYGESWEARWDRHIQNFGDKNANNFTESIGVPTAQEINQNEEHSVLRTVFEQKAYPYPDHIMTTCFFIPPESCEFPLDVSKGVKCEVQSSFTGVDVGRRNFNTCNILSRYSTEDGVHWYTANVTVTTLKQNGEGKGRHKVTEYYLVDYLPRYAIRLVNKPYTKDQYGKGAFRQHIGVGESMMPEQWLDLRQNVAAKDEL